MNDDPAIKITPTAFVGCVKKAAANARTIAKISLVVHEAEKISARARKLYGYVEFWLKLSKNWKNVKL